MLVGTIEAETLESNSSPVVVGAEAVVRMITEESTSKDVAVKVEIEEVTVVDVNI